MIRIIALLLLPLMTLAACDNMVAGPQVTTSGKMVPKIYRIRGVARTQYAMLDGINSLREAAGLSPVTLNARLNAAAATHSRDMSLQNRPWHFGSDGSSPIDRVQRVGYPGQLVGEAISETYETELETLAAWMEDEHTRSVIMAPEATEMGFAWEQEPNGKIWWTLVMGRSSDASPTSS